MTADELPPGPEVEEINLSITDGIKSCRSMVANYRAMISGDEETNDNVPEAEAANDRGEADRTPSEIGN